LQLDSCLNVSLGIDFTLSEYLQWLDECNLDFIPCDSLLEILNAYNAINVGIRPPLAVFLYDTLGINLTVEEFMVLFTNCSYDPVDFEDCDSLELFFDLCGSSVAPHLIDSCLNTFTNLDLTLTSYLSWLDSCQIPHDSISCGLLSMAVSQYPCWQDTISLTGWINYYLELNQQDIYYILYMDSCGIVPPCCGQLSNALDSFPCFTTSMSTYDWLDSTMQVNLPDSFWISTMDSCGISFSCDTCTWLSSQVYGYPCQDTLTLTQWLNIYSGLTMSDSAWFALIDTCGIDYPCSISCTEIQMILVDYPCDSSLTIAQWLNSQTSFQYSDSTWMVMLDTCDIMIPCIPDCDSLSNIIPQFPCDFSTSLTDWLNEQFGLSLSEQEYLFALDSCGITFQCDSCNYLDSLIGTYTCNDSLSLTEWLNDHTGWSLNDTAYMALLDSCNITWDTLCVPPCDSLQLLQGSYPCNSGIPITTWLNDILNLAFTDYEWGQIFIDCPVDTMHCICPPLDSLVLLYPCNDSLALVDWLNIQTGWNLSDSVYLFYLDSCKIAWDTVCTNCDTLQLLQSSYPCNSTLTVGEWFNQQLNLSYTDLEWDFILSECRINLACDSCSLLDSLIGSFPCNDTLTLSEWLNQQIGWSKTDSQYVSMLDSCDLYDAWQAQCDSCVADFTFTIDSLNCHRVHFVNQSNSSIALTSYHWNFGASTFGDNDSVPDPTELYFTNDTFTVCLTITHRDSSGNILCTDSVCKDVIIISTPLVTISVDSATFCKGQTQVLVANAGASVISYLWNPGGSTNDSLIVSSAGTYIVQVSNGTCFASDTQVISLYDTLSPNITIIGSANLCTGSTTSDLQADLDSYNTPASSWLWSTTETTNLITVYTQGTYCVTALDVHGCYVHACQEITETALPDPPVIDPSSTFTICTDGFIFEGDSIHCLNYSNNLLWSTSETTQSIYVDYEDNFYVIYTDSNGCFSTSSSVSVILNYFSLPPDSISSNHAGNTTCGGVAVMLTEYGGLLSSGVNQPNDQGYWAWYADSCGGTLIDTGASVTVYPTATTTYYVRAEGSCGSSCDSITITVQSCDPCLVLDSLLNEYPCNDTLSLVDWLNQQTNWNLTDSAWLAVIDSCSLDSSWIPNCIPSCDSIQLIEHSFPCDSNITLYAWLNDTLNVSYSETEWDSIFVWCPPDTLCGLDSCEILTAFYNEWDSAGTYGPLETWFNYQLQMNYSYWDYLQMLDDCGTYIQIPCDSIDSLLAIYNLIPEPKIIFRVWLTFQVGLHYPDIDFNLSLDSCNIIPPPINCDTFRLYVDYFEAYHPAQNIIEWLNNVLGENYLLSDYLQWFDTCGPTPSLCDYYDSLYTYYTSNADTVPLEQWFNDQTGLNYTYWQYVYLLQDCFPVSIPCDTLLYVWNAANNLPVPIPFYLYANNYWGLNYTPDWYCYLLDSCGIYSGPCDTSSCDSLQMLYSTYNAIIPQPDLTTWMNDTLGLNFSYWEYVQWFDTCIYLPLPCDTISNLYIYHRDNNISIPFADWMNNHLNLNYSLAYYQHLLDSCNIVDRCDSLDMAITAFLTQPDTSLDFTTFMNTYLGWSLTLEQYQSELADCHQDTAIWLCDGGIVQPSADSILTEDCMDDFIQMAFSNAQHNYDLYLDSLKGAFVDQYTSHCLNSFNEDFYVDGPFSEYHYTLYYYDQAGNLAQTIPPNGVVPFSDSDTLEDIAEFRSNPYGSSLPIYRVSPYATHYNYNTLNKPVGQHTPDADSAHFWYDRLGRLIFSRNAQQRIDAVMSMSYTVYDDLGRIAEVGKMDTLPFLGITDDWARDTLMVNYYLENSHHTEITHTYYDAPAFSPSSGFEQENLRNRVASITWENNNDHDSLTFDFATHYTYDITGNVRTILQETPQLAVIGQNLKRIDYDYDLVSGKVNYVYYQKDSIDQFIHHYEYDDDNRITHVYTSRDNMLWDEDAHYDYYLHGPLARVELGQHKVQGVDYAYTLQGWMKGINSSTLYPDRDMGRDGKDLSNGFSCDAYGFSLGYFYHDYKQIDPDTNWQADYTAGGAGSTFGTDAFGSATNLGLYNGNIRHTVLSMDSMNYPNIGYVYQYDQLNRLKEMNAYANLDTINNEWDNTAALADYKELIDFDPNGNILNYLRRGTTTGTHTLGMDSLSYSYNSGNNKLDHVSDNSAYNSNYTEDIDAGQSSGNYDYDANGNLIADAAEGLNMTWWNNGKLKSVAKAAGDTLTFYYDVSGNRVMKKYFNNLCSRCAG